MKQIAVITTVYRYLSHAQHMADRFLVGYPHNGEWHRPDMKVVSLYVDQKPSDDQSAQRAQEFGFRVYPTIAEALRCGGDRLAVDAVLIIGEHGDYPRNEKGQILYPRYEFFKQCVEVFEKDGRAVPVYNDKHLSYSFEKAKWMVEASKRLKFPMLAGSSLPVTWRLPDLELPLDGEIESALMVGEGGSDAMDFHALEAMQCMVERRKGGETGVKAVQMIEGEAVWRAGEEGRWSKEMLSSALSRSDTPLGLTLVDGRTQDLVGSGELPKLVKNPAAYFIDYNDGLHTTLLMLDGALKDFNFAARRRGTKDIRLHPVLPLAGSQCHLLRLPGEQDRGDVSDRPGALSGGAHAAGERGARGLPHLAPPGSSAPGDAAAFGALSRSPRFAVLPGLRCRSTAPKQGWLTPYTT